MFPKLEMILSRYYISGRKIVTFISKGNLMVNGKLALVHITSNAGASLFTQAMQTNQVTVTVYLHKITCQGLNTYRDDIMV